ncbi:MAG: LapD/MoxY N-terminal periplasmic domain-containing protein [Polaromonas sp.]|nr:LapD/MoxY N-terminal periplasmic domain-containing protein [Polaromonas sp.]
MSMYRQMWLAIILSMLLALLGGLLASTLNARSYLSEQLSAKNTDNATALALALSQQNADAVMIELAVSALFDGGHYASISVVDPLGKTIVEKVAPVRKLSVPDWFTQLLPLYARPGKASISSGWNQVGTLTLISSSRFAYEALWKSVLQLVAALALAGLVGGVLAATILGRLREPLQRVINQANAISERRFVLIDVPDVPELRQLAIAMNGTVARLKTMFAEEAHRLEVLRLAANYDALTGLANRTFFLVQLLDSLDSDEAAGSTLLLVRLADFSTLSQRIGASSVHDLLKKTGEALRHQALLSHAVAARIGDGDFALLLPAQVDARQVATQLMASLVQANAPWTADGPAACIGMSKLMRGQDMPSLMAQASSALIAAEAQGGNTIRQASPELASEAGEETATLIRLALEQNRTRLRSLPVTDMSGKLLHRECTLELMLGSAAGWEPARHVMQAAEAGQLTPAMDLQAIKLAQEKLAGEPHLPGLSITLSTLSISAEQHYTKLLDQIRKSPGVASRLWLEVAESAAVKHIDSFRAFAAKVRQAGSRAGLRHFGRRFDQADALHDLGLDYLKVDSSFVRGLQYSADNQIFLQGLALAAHKMGMQVLAGGLIDRAELVALDAAGFDGVAGPAVKEPA